MICAELVGSWIMVESQLESGDLGLNQNIVVVTWSITVVPAQGTLGFSCFVCKTNNHCPAHLMRLRLAKAWKML